MKLSILVPTVTERAEQRDALLAKLLKQADGKPVEILSLIDNRKRSIGLKRQSLVDIARGEYITFCDDDDDVSEDYVDLILAEIAIGADLITFEQQAIWNNTHSHVVFGLNHKDEPFANGGTTKRAPWHVCVWRRDKVAECKFLDANWGEDYVWSLQARRKVRDATHIPKIIHFYTHQDASSLAMLDTPATA